MWWRGMVYDGEREDLWWRETETLVEREEAVVVGRGEREREVVKRERSEIGWMKGK
jgi:hypothetical protein